MKWSYAGTIVNAGLQIGLTAVLARLLVPAAFGIVAMASLALRLGQYFAQLGLASALVQSRDISRRDISGSNWMCWGLGLAFTVLFFAGASVMAMLFKSPALTPVMEWMSLNFVLVGGSIVPLALLRRQLRFRAVALIDVSSYIVGYGVVGLAAAISGAGVWSLVAAALVQSLVQLGAGLATSRNLLVFMRPGLPSPGLLRFGYRVSVIGFLEFLATNLDTFGVGRVLGATQLGYYSRGYNLAYLPAYYLTNSLSRVLQSSYSRIQDELGRLQRSFLESVALLSAVTIPLSLGVMGASREIVLCLLGPNWTPVIPVVAIMSVAAPLTALTRVGETVAEATAKLNQKLLIRSAHVIVFVAILIAFARYGIIGFAFAFSFSELLVFIAYYTLSNQILRIGLRVYLAQVSPSFVAGIVALGCTFGLSQALGRMSVSPFVILPLQIAVGGALSGLVLLRLRHGWLWRIVRTRLDYAGSAIAQGRFRRLFVLLDRLAFGGGVQPPNLRG